MSSRSPGDTYGTDDVSPYAAPTRMEDLSGLAPATMLTGELDLFVDLLPEPLAAAAADELAFDEAIAVLVDNRLPVIATGTQVMAAILRNSASPKANNTIFRVCAGAKTRSWASNV